MSWFYDLSTRTRTTFIGLFCSFLFVIAIAFFIYLEKSIQATNEAWVNFSKNTVEISESISRLKASIGYGGLIHNFKNFVIRNEARYAQNVENNVKDAKRELSFLQSKSETIPIFKDLKTIDEMVNAYNARLQKVPEQTGQMTPKQRDDLVKFNDTPALQALERLVRLSNVLLQTRRSDSQESLRTIFNAIHYAMVFSGLLLLVGIVLIYFMIRFDRTNNIMKAAIEQVNVLIDESPDGILTVDAHGDIKRCNHQATRIFEYTQTELLTMNVDQLVPADIAEKHKQNRHIYSKKPTRRAMGIGLDLNAITKGGRSKAVEISLSNVELPEGKCTIASIRDVSMQRAIDRALIAAQIEANHAIEANKAKSEFMACMSHELRTPLNAVIGFAELLELSTDKNMDQGKILSYANSIGMAGRSLLSLINDILDFAKIEAGKFQMSETVFSLAEEIHNAYLAFEAKAKKNNIRFTESLSNLDYFVEGDALRMSQVLNNLLDNALKFSQNGNVEISARVDQLPDNKIHLKVQVSDDGIGIPTERVKRIFEPFVQTDSTIAREFGGTGLGLSISRTLARLMDGDVTVESTENVGSVFTASFIFTDKTETHHASTCLPANAQTTADYSLSVLAVDDVESNLDIIESMLDGFGCVVHKARNGQEAIDWMGSHQPDLILMDLHMPVLDGIKAARSIQSTSDDPKQNVPIFAWTADVTSQESLAESNVQWAGTLIKPTTRDSLVMALDSVAK